MSNPFTITFGKKPNEYVSRPLLQNEIIEEYLSEQSSNQVYMITGVRGSGKTVLMTQIAATLREKENWIVLECNPEVDLLSNAASKLSSNPFCSEIFRNAKLNLSALGLGIEIKGVPPIRDVETALSEMLRQLKNHGKRVLFTIDEATNNQNMRIFAASFQNFLRQDLPVYLIMTGLYENIEELQNEKSLTFLYRAPKIRMKPLNIFTISDKYKEIFETDESTARNMARMTGGYPFAFQVLGYLCWENRTYNHSVIIEFRHYLEEYVYDKIWSELSKKDRTVIKAVAEAGDGSIKVIRERLHMSTNEFNPYRQRLIKKGILNGDQHGQVYLELPQLKEFILSKYED